MRRLVASVLVLSGCTIGPRVNKFAPVRDPRGITTTVTRGRVEFIAELLAATDTALLVRNTRSDRIVLVPYRVPTRVVFRALPVEYTLRKGRPPEATTLERLRLWSRYPTGVDGALLQRLLSAYGQDSLDVLAPCPSSGC